MTLEQIREERKMLEGQIDLAVAQFKRRCGLEDWQVQVSWGACKISTQVGDGPVSPSRDVYMASVTVRA